MNNNDNLQNAAGAIVGLGLLMVILVLALAYYIFTCYCQTHLSEMRQRTGSHHLDTLRAFHSAAGNHPDARVDDCVVVRAGREFRLAHHAVCQAEHCARQKRLAGDHAVHPARQSGLHSLSGVFGIEVAMEKIAA